MSSQTTPENAPSGDAPLPGPTDPIAPAVAALGASELTEQRIKDHLWPLFSRVLARRQRTRQIYLANHSLGRPLDRTADDVAHALNLWYRDLDKAWGPWADMIDRYRALNAQIIGCARPDAVVHKVSAGQGLRTVLNALEPKGERLRVLTTRGEFDACDFILKRYHAKGRIDLDWVEADDRGRFDPATIAGSISNHHDLVVVSTVFYATGQHLDPIVPVIEAAHACEAKILLDTYHQAGVMPVRFDDIRADFAIGGNYKYTRGGPGACWLAIRHDHLDNDDLRPIDTGWFAKDDHFGFERSDQARLAPGGDGWQEGTPALLTMVQALAGLELTLAVGLERLQTYNQRQCAFLADRLREIAVGPVDDRPRGAFILVRVDDLKAATTALADRGVIADGRPDSNGTCHVRFCPDILTTEAELTEAAPRIRDACGSG
ncbi:MAG: aminotransferase class V-fold PLP-dependent enzyme [Planctomycetota bacterium]